MVKQIPYVEGLSVKHLLAFLVQMWDSEDEFPDKLEESHRRESDLQMNVSLLWSLYRRLFRLLKVSRVFHYLYKSKTEKADPKECADHQCVRQIFIYINQFIWYFK